MKMKGMASSAPADLTSFLLRCHSEVKSTWDNPAVRSMELVFHTYLEAVRLGFKGHMRQWVDSVLEGTLLFNKVPSKLQVKLDEA